MKKPAVSGRGISGWGADLNPANRPMVPREVPSDVTTVRGVRPSQQRSGYKVHLSVEHPDMTPVYGTSCPPRGLSGALRDFAYQYGEGRLARWMTLMFADRVDVLEGRLEDLAHGRLPHPLRERGLDAEVAAADRSHQKRTLMLAGAGVGLVTLGVVMAARMRSNGG